MGFRGRAAHIARLKKMGSPESIRLIGAALFEGGDILADSAKASIMQGAVSGKNHIPSKPGEPPKNDTQVLHDGIVVEQIAQLKVRVSSTARYGSALEFGTSKMAERPYFRPAKDRTKAEIRDRVGANIDIIVKRSRSTAKD